MVFSETVLLFSSGWSCLAPLELEMQVAVKSIQVLGTALGPLGEQEVSLTTEPPLQPLVLHLSLHLVKLLLNCGTVNTTLIPRARKWAWTLAR